MHPTSNQQTSRRSFVVKLGLSIALLGYCIYIVDLDKLSSNLHHLDPWLFVLAFLINVLGTVILKALLVWRLISSEHSVQFIKVIAINFALRFYTIVLPRAAVAGVRWFKYKQITNSTESLVLLTFETLLTLSLLALGAFVFSLIDRSGVIDPSIYWLAGFTTLLLVLTQVVLFFVPANLVHGFFARRSQNHWLVTKIVQFIKQWTIVTRKMDLLRWNNSLLTVLISISSYILFLVSSYILLLSLNLDISFVTIAWMRSAILLLAHIPISIAGLGVRELGFVVLFGMYGYSAESALAYALISFTLQLGIAFIGALIELSSWFISKRDSEQKQRAGKISEPF